MRMLISVLLLTSLMNISSACEQLMAEHLEPINHQQATKRLSETLFKHNRLASEPDANLPKIDCYLSRKIENDEKQSDTLAKIQLPLRDLGQLFSQASTQREKRSAINAINSQVARDAGTGFVVFPSIDNKTLEINLFSTLINQACGLKASAECARSTELAQNLWWIAGEYRGFSDHLNQYDKKSSSVFNQNLDTQWRSYNEDTLQLWPQEVLMNSIIYQPSKQGLSSPPRYKLIGLRPSIGLSYLSDQSHRVQPTLNVDLVGVYWWEYGNDNKAQTGRGIAATLIWDGDDTAYGLSYHHNPKWSFTIAHGNDNDIVVSMSFQLAHWLLKK